MNLSDGIAVISAVLGGIVNLLMSISLFGIPIGVFFVSAFIVSVIMQYVFSLESSSGSSKDSKRKGGGE